MKRTKQPANTYDSGMTGPRDNHRVSPLLPPIVVLLGALVVACGLLAWLVLGWI